MQPRRYLRAALSSSTARPSVASMNHTNFCSASRADCTNIGGAVASTEFSGVSTSPRASIGVRTSQSWCRFTRRSRLKTVGVKVAKSTSLRSLLCASGGKYLLRMHCSGAATVTSRRVTSSRQRAMRAPVLRSRQTKCPQIIPGGRAWVDVGAPEAGGAAAADRLKSALSPAA
jgi:hypothetical protein